jgi:hypothetical protein
MEWSVQIRVICMLRAWPVIGEVTFPFPDRWIRGSSLGGCRPSRQATREGAMLNPARYRPGLS